MQQRRIRHALWVTLSLLLIFSGAYHGSVLPILVIDLDALFVISAVLLGLLLSSSSIGTMLAGGIAGPMIDYFGARKVLIWSIAAVSVSLVVGGLAPTFTLYLVAAVAISMAFNALSMSIPLYIIALNPTWQRKGFALNLVTGVVPGIFFPYVTERLIAAESVPFESVFRIPYLIIGAMCGGLFLAFLARAPKAGDPGKRETSLFAGLRSRLAPVFRRKRTWLFILLAVLHGTADSTIFQWFPTYLVGRFDRLIIGPGLTMSLFSLSYFLSRIIIVILPEHVGRRTFVVVPGFVGGSCMLVSLYVRDPTAASLFYVLGAFFWSFEFPALFSEAFRETRGVFGSFQSVAFLITSGISFLFNNIIGVAVATGIRLEWLLSIAAVLFIVFGAASLLGRVGVQSKNPES